MNVIDATKDILAVYETDQFCLDKWKSYMESSVPQAKELCLHDMEDSLTTGLTWEADYLGGVTPLGNFCCFCSLLLILILAN